MPVPKKLTGEIEIIGCTDEGLNIFHAKQGATTLVCRQPRSKDIRIIRRVRKKVSEQSFGRFTTQDEKGERNWPKYMCKQPLFRKGDLGKLRLIMEIEEEIVGFGIVLFAKAETFTMHGLPDPDETAAYNRLLILDEYQRRGIGTLHGHLTEPIAAHFGADWIIGMTYGKRGMLGIRKRMGWQIYGVVKNVPGGRQYIMRKRLS